MNLTFIDLFSGCGGLTQGFVDAGFTPVFAVESDLAAAKTYEANFGNHVFARPIEELTPDEVPKATVVIGGPPCQGFSNLGKVKPTKEHGALRELWQYFMNVVEWVKPQAFVMENVPNLLTSPQFEGIRHRASELGYGIRGEVVNAAEFGVPQKRRRAIIIGVRNMEPPPIVPPYVFRTVRDAIGDLPLEPDGVNWHIGRNPTPISIERYKCIPPGGNRFDLMEKRPDLTPQCWLKKKTGATDVFGRLKWDDQALTIRTEFFKPEKGRYLHPEAHRPITHREAADLQTFPRTFKFCGSRVQVARQIGNAVPPLLAKYIGLHVRSLLERAHSASDDSSSKVAQLALIGL